MSNPIFSIINLPNIQTANEVNKSFKPIISRDSFNYPDQNQLKVSEDSNIWIYKNYLSKNRGLNWTKINNNDEVLSSSVSNDGLVIVLNYADKSQISYSSSGIMWNIDYGPNGSGYSVVSRDGTRVFMVGRTKEDIKLGSITRNRLGDNFDSVGTKITCEDFNFSTIKKLFISRSSEIYGFITNNSIYTKNINLANNLIKKTFTCSEIIDVDVSDSEIAVVVKNPSNMYELYLSYDKGKNWSLSKTFSEEILSVSIANLAQKILVSCKNNLYYTINNGTTWNNIFSNNRILSKTITNALLTYEGDQIIITENDRSFISVDNGLSWSQKWYDSKLSKSGSVLIANEENRGLYVNKVEKLINNSSNDFFLTSVGEITGKVACSYDGDVLGFASINGFVILSIDNGNTWKVQYDLGFKVWRSIDISDDGNTIIVAAKDDYLYISNNRGNSWTRATGAGIRSWTDVAVSVDSRTIYALSNITPQKPDQPVISKDGGQTWSPMNNLPISVYISMAGSDDGKIIVVAQRNGRIYISNDQQNFTIANIQTSEWVSVDTTSDGGKIFAAEKNGYIYASTDLGQTWYKEPSFEVYGSRDWTSVTVTDDGYFLSASEYNGFTYALFNPPVVAQTIDDLTPSPTSISPTPSPTSKTTRTPTPTITATATPTISITPTITNSQTSTQTQTPTVTPTLTPVTPTPSVSLGASQTPTPTRTATHTPTPTKTITLTPTNTRTPTKTPTVTKTQTATPTVTPTVTITSTPQETVTSTPTNTHTPSVTAVKKITGNFTRSEITDKHITHLDYNKQKNAHIVAEFNGPLYTSYDDGETWSVVPGTPNTILSHLLWVDNIIFAITTNKEVIVKNTGATTYTAPAITTEIIVNCDLFTKSKIDGKYTILCAKTLGSVIYNIFEPTPVVDSYLKWNKITDNFALDGSSNTIVQYGLYNTEYFTTNIVDIKYIDENYIYSTYSNNLLLTRTRLNVNGIARGTSQDNRGYYSTITDTISITQSNTNLQTNISNQPIIDRALINDFPSDQSYDAIGIRMYDYKTFVINRFSASIAAQSAGTYSVIGINNNQFVNITRNLKYLARNESSLLYVEQSDNNNNQTKLVIINSNYRTIHRYTRHLSSSIKELPFVGEYDYATKFAGTAQYSTYSIDDRDNGYYDRQLTLNFSTRSLFIAPQIDPSRSGFFLEKYIFNGDRNPLSYWYNVRRSNTYPGIYNYSQYSFNDWEEIKLVNASNILTDTVKYSSRTPIVGNLSPQESTIIGNSGYLHLLNSGNINYFNGSLLLKNIQPNVSLTQISSADNVKFYGIDANNKIYTSTDLKFWTYTGYNPSTSIMPDPKGLPSLRNNRYLLGDEFVKLVSLTLTKLIIAYSIIPTVIDFTKVLPTQTPTPTPTQTATPTRTPAITSSPTRTPAVTSTPNGSIVIGYPIGRNVTSRDKVVEVGTAGGCSYYGVYDALCDGITKELVNDPSKIKDYNNIKELLVNNNNPEYNVFRLVTLNNIHNLNNFVPVRDYPNTLFLEDTLAGNTYGRNIGGGVDYEYQIGRYLVTNCEYVYYLNLQDPTGNNYDDIYDTRMLNNPYSKIVLDQNKPLGERYSIIQNANTHYIPVLYMTQQRAQKYINWLNNDGPIYKTVNVNSTLLDIKYRLPTVDELIKAALYKGGSLNAGYWNYGTQSDNKPISTNVEFRDTEYVCPINDSRIAPTLTPTRTNTATPTRTPNPTTTPSRTPQGIPAVPVVDGVFSPGRNTTFYTSDITEVGSAGGPSAYGIYDALTGSDFVELTRDYNSSRLNINNIPELNYQNVKDPAFVSFRLSTISNRLNLNNFVNIKDYPNILFQEDILTGNIYGRNVGGGVDYEYNISQYLVTNCEYVKYLNIQDPMGTNEDSIYDTRMADNKYSRIILDPAKPSGQKYSILPNINTDYMPVLYMTIERAQKYINWLNNDGRIYGKVYIGRTLGEAVYRLPSVDEIIKAALYKGGSNDAGYWTYGTQSNTTPSIGYSVNTNYVCEYSNDRVPPTQTPSRTPAITPSRTPAVTRTPTRTPANTPIIDGSAPIDGLYPAGNNTTMVSLKDLVNNVNYVESRSQGGRTIILQTVRDKNINRESLRDVGSNGGPSAYGLYDILDYGALSEWAKGSIIKTSTAYHSGGNIRSDPPNGSIISLPNMLLTDTNQESNYADSHYVFRIASKNNPNNIPNLVNVLDVDNQSIDYNNSPLLNIGPGGGSYNASDFTDYAKLVSYTNKKNSGGKYGSYTETLFGYMIKEYVHSYTGGSYYSPVEPERNILTLSAPLGGVDYAYTISKYLVTNCEYVNYLNNQDPDGNNNDNIYDGRMTSDSIMGGIIFDPSKPRGEKYIVKGDMSKKPVTYISKQKAQYYINWLNNDGLIYGSVNVVSSTNDRYNLPTVNELIKAGLYKGGSLNAGYWKYGTQSNTAPTTIASKFINTRYTCDFTPPTVSPTPTPTLTTTPTLTPSPTTSPIPIPGQEFKLSMSLADLNIALNNSLWSIKTATNSSDGNKAAILLTSNNMSSFVYVTNNRGKTWYQISKISNTLATHDMVSNNDLSKLYVLVNGPSLGFNHDLNDQVSLLQININYIGFPNKEDEFLIILASYISRITAYTVGAIEIVDNTKIYYASKMINPAYLIYLDTSLLDVTTKTDPQKGEPYSVINVTDHRRSDRNYNLTAPVVEDRSKTFVTSKKDLQRVLGTKYNDIAYSNSKNYYVSSTKLSTDPVDSTLINEYNMLYMKHPPITKNNREYSYTILSPFRNTSTNIVNIMTSNTANICYLVNTNSIQVFDNPEMRGYFGFYNNDYSLISDITLNIAKNYTGYMINQEIITSRPETVYIDVKDNQYLWIDVTGARGYEISIPFNKNTIPSARLYQSNAPRRPSLSSNTQSTKFVINTNNASWRDEPLSNNNILFPAGAPSCSSSNLDSVYRSIDNKIYKAFALQYYNLAYTHIYNIISICCSSNGQYIYALDNIGNLIMSADYGENFVVKSDPALLYKVDKFSRVISREDAVLIILNYTDIYSYQYYGTGQPSSYYLNAENSNA